MEAKRSTGRGSLESYGRKENGKGFCGVIANFYSEHEEGDNHLPGYFKDVENIKDFFEGELQYEVKVESNLKREEFLETLRQFQNIVNKGNFDRLVVFILSHGSEEGINTCKDSSGKDYEMEGGDFLTVKVETIIHAFDHCKVPNLKGYPKCIFIQTCRGSNLVACAAQNENQFNKDPSVQLSDGEIDSGENSMEYDNIPRGKKNISNETVKVSTEDKGIPKPSSADVSVAFACYPNTVSFVGDCTGSWFIIELLNNLKQYYKHEHVMDILIEVNKMVTNKSTSVSLPVNYTQQAKVVKIGNQDISVHAYYDGKLVGQVLYGTHGNKVKYRGIIKNLKTRIDSHHKINCIIESKTFKVTKEVTLTHEEYRRDVLENENCTVRPGSCQVIDPEKKMIIGIGNISLCPNDGKLIIDHIVEPYTENLLEYIGHRETGTTMDKTEIEKIDSLNDREAVLYEVFPYEGGSLTHEVKMPGKIVQTSSRSLPAFNVTAHQLCIFETTFTKRFYLSNDEPAEARTDNDKVHPDTTQQTACASASSGYIPGQSSDTLLSSDKQINYWKYTSILGTGLAGAYYLYTKTKS